MKQPTPRQMDVLRRRATGESIIQTADALGISDQTVRNHLTDAYRRLGVTNIVEAFVRLGWLREH